MTHKEYDVHELLTESLQDVLSGDIGQKAMDRIASGAVDPSDLEQISDNAKELATEGWPDGAVEARRDLLDGPVNPFEAEPKPMLSAAGFDGTMALVRDILRTVPEATLSDILPDGPDRNPFADSADSSGGGGSPIPVGIAAALVVGFMVVIG